MLEIIVYIYIDKYKGVAHSICNSKYNRNEEFPVVFHSESNYNY